MSSHGFVPLVLLGLLGASAPALAAPDLVTTVTTPSGVHVYESGTYTVRVRNSGSSTAFGAKVVVHLPATNTSPGVFVMGQVGALPNGCTLSGTKVTCLIGTLKKTKFKDFAIPLTLPEASTPLQLVAVSSTTNNEPNQGNNTASVTPTLLTYPVSFTGDRDVYNEHCTGTGLTSFYECTLYPGSIMSHDIVFHAGGTLSIPIDPSYGGTWTQPSANELSFMYTELGTPVMWFSGHGVGGDCWEGLVVFSTGSWVSQYRVCLN